MLLILLQLNVDVILGRHWLAQHQPTIDWSTGEILEWGVGCKDHDTAPSTSTTSVLFYHLPSLSCRIQQGTSHTTPSALALGL